MLSHCDGEKSYVHFLSCTLYNHNNPTYSMSSILHHNFWGALHFVAYLKDWFPFTNYDFYAYLASGLVLLCAIDFWATGGQLLRRENWTFLQGSVVVAVGYITGQIVSIPASGILEGFVAHTLLRPPIAVLISAKSNCLERFLSRFLIGRYYAPLPSGTREKILARAEMETGLSRSKLCTLPEEIFAPAHSWARKFEDTRNRMDDFRNQYGFNRNMAMTSFITTLLMFDRFRHHDDDIAAVLMVFALLLSLGMMLRFLKFYSSFAAEVFQVYAYREEKP